uniref:Uncharacterized protein n=1 Tax=Pithovirus LCPAC001 TaxID=2506585 RepID=A0A481Z283_9VIRU|nr:MAG: hypothetical protein LCPAC001_00540 [Pithovirus LCPAC001]
MNIVVNKDTYNEFLENSKEICIERMYENEIYCDYSDDEMWNIGKYTLEDLTNWIIPRILIKNDLLPDGYWSNFGKGIEKGIISQKYEYQPVVDAVNKVKNEINKTQIGIIKK